MKAFLLVCFLVVPAFGKTIWVTGTGNASGSCKGGDNFCPRNIEDRAERTAESNARSTCYIKQGTPYGLPSCSTHCSPGYISPGQTAWVSCNANCRLNCDVKDNNVFGDEAEF